MFSQLISLGLGLTFGVTLSAAVAAPQVFVTGLETPSKLLTIAGGSVLISEAGTATPNTGRVSIVGPSGSRRTLIDSLPSGLAAPDFTPDGPNGLALDGRVLYIAIGEGDAHVNGPTAGTLLPNPKGPSSPLFDSVLRFQLSDQIDYIQAPFVVTSAMQALLADGKWVNIENGMGQTATVQMLVAFRPDRPDAHLIYRNTHIYGLALSPEKPGTLFVDDAGNNAIWKLSLSYDRPTVLVRFPNTPNPAFPAQGPPTSEAVPTSVHVFGNQLLVSLLSGAPFNPGASSVMLVDQQTGAAHPVITGLDSTVEVLPRFPGVSHNEYLVLEYSTNLSAGAPGQLVLYVNGKLQTLATGLVTPSSMALEGSVVYITDQADGTLSKLALP